MNLLIITDHDFAMLGSLQPHEQLQNELDRAIVVSSEAVPPDVVTMNSHVRYIDETTGERRSAFRSDRRSNGSFRTGARGDAAAPSRIGGGA